MMNKGRGGRRCRAAPPQPNIPGTSATGGKAKGNPAGAAFKNWPDFAHTWPRHSVSIVRQWEDRPRASRHNLTQKPARFDDDTITTQAKPGDTRRHTFFCRLLPIDAK
jgi:hypothetical protein